MCSNLCSGVKVFFFCLSDFQFRRVFFSVCFYLRPLVKNVFHLVKRVSIKLIVYPVRKTSVFIKIDVLTNVHRVCLKTKINVPNAIRCAAIAQVFFSMINRQNFVWLSFSFVLGPSETDCLTCAEGYVFNSNEQQCTSLCPNGNYFNRDDRVNFETTKWRFFNDLFFSFSFVICAQMNV